LQLHPDPGASTSDLQACLDFFPAFRQLCLDAQAPLVGEYSWRRHQDRLPQLCRWQILRFHVKEPPWAPSTLRLFTAGSGKGKSGEGGPTSF